MKSITCDTCGRQVEVPAPLQQDRCPGGVGHLRLHRLSGTGSDPYSYPVTITYGEE